MLLKCSCENVRSNIGCGSFSNNTTAEETTIQIFLITMHDQDIVFVCIYGACVCLYTIDMSLSFFSVPSISCFMTLPKKCVCLITPVTPRRTNTRTNIVKNLLYSCGRLHSPIEGVWIFVTNMLLSIFRTTACRVKLSFFSSCYHIMWHRFTQCSCTLCISLEIPHRSANLRTKLRTIHQQKKAKQFNFNWCGDIFTSEFRCICINLDWHSNKIMRIITKHVMLRTMITIPWQLLWNKKKLLPLNGPWL